MKGDGSFDDPVGQETADMLGALRRLLRAAGWTQGGIAEHLGVGVASVKRWLRGQGLSLHRMEQLCVLAGCSISELAQHIGQGSREDITMTLAQEEALTADPGLSTLFFLLVAGWPPEEATHSFRISAEDVERHLERLHRLALIDRLPGRRIRARIAPDHVWRRAPLRPHFDRIMKHHFFAMDYGDPQTIFGMETAKLSEIGVARLRDSIERFRAEIRTISERDRLESRLPSEWYAVLAVARSMTPLIEGSTPQQQSGSK